MECKHNYRNWEINFALYFIFVRKLMYDYCNMFVSIDGNINNDIRYNILVFERTNLLENEASY
jgi:hypothetical protein